MCANKKIQDISMKAATGNHQILGLPIVSQRPGRDGRLLPVNGWLILKNGHSTAASDRQSRSHPLTPKRDSFLHSFREVQQDQV